VHPAEAAWRNAVHRLTQSEGLSEEVAEIRVALIERVYQAISAATSAPVPAGDLRAMAEAAVDATGRFYFDTTARRVHGKR
jgi:hypothetical protein